MRFSKKKEAFPYSFCKGLGYLFLVLGLLHCNQKQQAYQSPLPQPTARAGMIFLSFKMTADSVYGNRLELLSKTVVYERLIVEPANSAAVDRVVVSQLASTEEVVASVAVDHPLKRRVEVANDQGEIQSREIILREAEFSVRVTLQPQTAYIRVTEVVANKTKSETTFNLKD